VPCHFTGPKNFCDGPNFLTKTKSLIAFSASSKNFVLAQKLNLLNENHLLVWHKMFVTSTICPSSFGLAQKIWTRSKSKCTKEVVVFRLTQFNTILKKVGDL
jgi:hypothetical protein